MALKELGIPIGPEVVEISTSVQLRALLSEEIQAGMNVAANSLGIRDGEKVLIVTDDERIEAAYVFAATARKLTPNVKFLSMTPRSGAGEEPPEEIAKALLKTGVFGVVTTYSLSHTKARKEANLNGARGFGMSTPGADINQTLELIQRTMIVDFPKIRQLTDRVASTLTGVSKIRVVTEDRGTDIVFSVAGREPHKDNGDLTKPGSYGNMPFGEVFFAIVEGSANGKITIGTILRPTVFRDEGRPFMKAGQFVF